MVGMKSDSSSNHLKSASLWKKNGWEMGKTLAFFAVQTCHTNIAIFFHRWSISGFWSSQTWNSTGWWSDKIPCCLKIMQSWLTSSRNRTWCYQPVNALAPISNLEALSLSYNMLQPSLKPSCWVKSLGWPWAVILRIQAAWRTYMVKDRQTYSFQFGLTPRFYRCNRTVLGQPILSNSSWNFINEL